ncbi:MAG: DUF411 domain-containing protein [Pseudomonadota bacterium]
MITRRHFITLSTSILAATTLPVQARPRMHVLASPNCGCCHAWVELAQARGYAVTVEAMTDPQAQKASLSIPLELASCHTVEADGYVFEGHVPFEALEAVLRDRPNIVGLAVPGMPMGSPGMGDDPSARYDVIAFGGKAGSGAVFYRAGTPQPFAS